MQIRRLTLQEKLAVLNSLDRCEAADARLLQQKLIMLKEIALLLVEEIESLNSVRSVNISRGINLHDEMRSFEVHLVQSALERTGGHQTKAAHLLGISLTTLHNKLKRLNISLDAPVDAPVIHEDRDLVIPRTKREIRRVNTKVSKSLSA